MTTQPTTDEDILQAPQKPSALNASITPRTLKDLYAEEDITDEKTGEIITPGIATRQMTLAKNAANAVIQLAFIKKANHLLEDKEITQPYAFYRALVDEGFLPKLNNAENGFDKFTAQWKATWTEYHHKGSEDTLEKHQNFGLLLAMHLLERGHLLHCNDLVPDNDVDGALTKYKKDILSFRDGMDKYEEAAREKIKRLEEKVKFFVAENKPAAAETLKSYIEQAKLYLVDIQKWRDGGEEPELPKLSDAKNAENSDPPESRPEQKDVPKSGTKPEIADWDSLEELCLEAPGFTEVPKDPRVVAVNAKFGNIAKIYDTGWKSLPSSRKKLQDPENPNKNIDDDPEASRKLKDVNRLTIATNSLEDAEMIDEIMTQKWNIVHSNYGSGANTDNVPLYPEIQPFEKRNYHRKRACDEVQNSGYIDMHFNRVGKHGFCSEIKIIPSVALLEAQHDEHLIYEIYRRFANGSCAFDAVHLNATMLKNAYTKFKKLPAPEGKEITREMQEKEYFAIPLQKKCDGILKTIEQELTSASPNQNLNSKWKDIIFPKCFNEETHNPTALREAIVAVTGAKDTDVSDDFVKTLQDQVEEVQKLRQIIGPILKNRYQELIARSHQIYSKVITSSADNALKTAYLNAITLHNAKACPEDKFSDDIITGLIEALGSDPRNNTHQPQLI